MSKVCRMFVAQLLLCLLLSSNLLAPAWAQSSSSANSQTLMTLESKFFEHTYPTDSDDDRIARLEKLIFGESKSGDAQSRLAEIQKIVATNEVPTGNSGSAAGSTGGRSATSGGQTTAATNPASSASPSAATPPIGSYPRVDSLEELLLGQTNKTTPLEKRLGQLEKKAFGHVSNSDDLSARTDALEQYWQKSLSPSVNQKYDRSLTQLEAQVLGQSYPDKPIIERIQTLEGVVFPNEPPDTHASIKEQLETLANAVQMSQKQGRKPQASAADATAFQGTPSGAGSYGYANGGAPGGYGQSGAAPDQTAINNAPGQYGSYGQANPYASGQSGNYGTQSGYANADHPYPGDSAGNSYTPQGQYATNTAQTPPAQTPSNVGQLTPFTNSPTTNESYGGGNANGQQQKQGHPLLKGLAKALGAAAAIGAVGMGTGMMMGSMGSPYGYGGMGGYGYSPYGMGMGMPYGGMGGMGMGMPYGGMGMPYGGMGGLGGLGSGIRW